MFLKKIFRSPKKKRFSVSLERKSVNEVLLFSNTEIFNTYMATLENYLVELIMVKKYKEADVVGDIITIYKINKQSYDEKIKEQGYDPQYFEQLIKQHNEEIAKEQERREKEKKVKNGEWFSLQNFLKKNMFSTNVGKDFDENNEEDNKEKADK